MDAKELKNVYNEEFVRVIFSEPAATGPEAHIAGLVAVAKYQAECDASLVETTPTENVHDSQIENHLADLIRLEAKS